MRIKNFDGLRGLAAISVVIHHFSLTIPWFADRVGQKAFSPKGHFASLSLHNIIEYSPLHIFYAGTESVCIFFVISGYVLVFAIQKSDLRNYLRNRAVRLWTPIAGSVMLAAILLATFSRNLKPEQSSWLQGHVIKTSIGSLFQNIWFFDGSTGLDSSPWSMKYELFFSMAVLIFAGISFKEKLTHFLLTLIGIFFALYWGSKLNLDLLSYLPMFFAGSALHLLPKRSGLATLRAIAGIIVLLAPWYFVGFGYQQNLFVQKLSMTLGALILVDSCRIEETLLGRFLKWKPISFTGRYSYSLYLIHSPVLVTVWFIMGQPQNHVDWFFHLLVSIPLIALATIFIYVFFERTSLRYLGNKNRPLLN